MKQLLSSNGLTDEVSDIVAEASMLLPPLTHPYDADFLRRQTTKAVSIFLHAYMEGCAPDVRAAFHEAQNENDSLNAGVILHESLGQKGAEQRARAAFGNARNEIINGIVDDYETYVRSLASRKNT